MDIKLIIIPSHTFIAPDLFQKLCSRNGFPIIANEESNDKKFFIGKWYKSPILKCLILF